MHLLGLTISAVTAQYWYNSNYNQPYTTIQNLARAGHSCVGKGADYPSQMLCFGGFNSTGNVTQVVYSTTTNTISSTTIQSTSKTQTATTTQAPFNQYTTNSYNVSNVKTTMATNDLLLYSHLSHAWSVVSTTTKPTQRAHHVMVAHESAGYALMHGGLTYAPNDGTLQHDGISSNAASVLKDLWLLDFATQQWTLLSSNGPALWMHSLVYDSVRDTFLIHGGMVDASGVQSNATYRIRVDPITKSLTDIVMLTSMPIYVSQHTMEVYQNPTTGSQFFLLFGGVSTFPATSAGPSTNSLWVFQCLNGNQAIDYAGCTWLQQGSSTGTLTRFGHDTAINSVTGEMFVSGGVVGSSVVNSVVVLSILTDSIGQWQWTTASTKQLQNPTTLHTLTMISSDVNTTQLVNFGGMDAVYPVQDVSLGVTYKRHVEVGYFSYGAPYPLPQYTAPVFSKLPPWTDGNVSIANIVYNTGQRNSSSSNSTFSSQIQSSNAIIAGSSVGGTLVVLFIGMFIYVRFVNPSYAKQHSFLKFMAPAEEAIANGDD